MFAPRQVGVGAVVQQPVHARGSLRRIGGPTQDVTKGRHSARNAVEVNAKAMQ